MRASTIFALCLALLVGLAAAVVNRVVAAGMLDFD